MLASGEAVKIIEQNVKRCCIDLIGEQPEMTSDDSTLDALFFFILLMLISFVSGSKLFVGTC